MNRMDKDRAQVPDRMKNPPTAWRKRLSKANLGSRTRKGSHAGEAKWTKMRLIALVNAIPVKYITHAHRRILIEIIKCFDEDKGFSHPSYDDLMRRAQVSSRVTVAKAIPAIESMGLMQCVSGGGRKGGKKDAPGFANEYHLDFNVVIHPITGSLIDARAVAMALFPDPNSASPQAIEQYSECTVEIDECTVGNASVPAGDSDNDEIVQYSECTPTVGHVGVGSSSADTPSAQDATGEPSSSPHEDEVEKAEKEKPKRKSAYDGYEREGDWCPVVKKLPSSEVMSYLEYSLAEWNLMITPKNPEKAAITRYLAGSLPDDVAAKVGDWLADRYRKKTVSSDDYTPLDDFGDDIHIDNSSFHSSVDLRAALSNDGDRMIVYTIK